jgi:hypothetical protein
MRRKPQPGYKPYVIKLTASVSADYKEKPSLFDLAQHEQIRTAALLFDRIDIVVARDVMREWKRQEDK